MVCRIGRGRGAAIASAHPKFRELHLLCMVARLDYMYAADGSCDAAERAMASTSLQAGSTCAVPCKVV
jgi:hypothetical protein